MSLAHWLTRKGLGFAAAIGAAPALAGSAACPPEPALLELTIADLGSGCFEIGDMLQVDLRMSCLDQPVSGYQAFLEFDSDLLLFSAGNYARPQPFGLPLLFPISANNGEIDLAAGVNILIGQAPTEADARLATLWFEATGFGTGQVEFRPHNPPNRMSSEDLPIIPALRPTPLFAVRQSCALLIGDMNCDGFVSVSDIAGFVLALTNPAGYAAAYPLCDRAAGDVNQDGAVSVSDIGPFVALLAG